jgi:hypothetical protein
MRPDVLGFMRRLVSKRAAPDLRQQQQSGANSTDLATGKRCRELHFATLFCDRRFRTTLRFIERMV